MSYMNIYFLGSNAEEVQSILGRDIFLGGGIQLFNQNINPDIIYSQVITPGELYKFQRNNWTMGRASVSHVGSKKDEPALQITIATYEGQRPIKKTKRGGTKNITSIKDAFRVCGDYRKKNHTTEKIGSLIVYTTPTTELLMKREKYTLSV